MRPIYFTALTILSLASSHIARADYTADMRLQFSVDKARTVAGKIFAKGTKTRVDVSGDGQNSSIISDSAARTVYMVDHTHRTVVTRNDAANRGMKVEVSQLQECMTKDAAKCFKEHGFTKVGTETIDGHPCTIFEGHSEEGDDVTRIWHPDDLKEAVMLRSEVKDAATSQVKARTDVTNIKFGAIADDKFGVPADYKKVEFPQIPASNGQQPSSEDLKRIMEELKSKRGAKN